MPNPSPRWAETKASHDLYRPISSGLLVKSSTNVTGAPRRRFNQSRNDRSPELAP